MQNPLKPRSGDRSSVEKEDRQSGPPPVSWDDYFMLIALVTSLRSKDPNTKTGAVVVDSMNHIVGTGYNGFVGGSDESYFSWESNGEWLETKHAYVVHAEVNAILNSTTHALAGCHLYTTLFPCNECAKVISQKKIIEVIYLSAKNFDHETRIAARSIFEASRITTRQISMPPLEEFADWVISRMVL